MAEESLRAKSGRSARRRAWDRWMGRLLPFSFAIAILPILDMIYWIGARALPTLTWTTLTTDPTGLSGGLYGPLVGTLDILALSTAISTVLGVAGAAWVAEFAGPRWADVCRTGANLLAGVPSIVVGYFGYFALVLYFGWGPSLLSGSVTLAIFLVPYIFRATDLAISGIPQDLREAALGLGASRGQYLTRVGLPVALPRILNSILLAASIGIGETAPLLYTAFFNNYPPTGLTSKTGYLTGLIWNYYDEPAHFGTEVTLAFQAAFLLLLIVIGLNVLVRVVSRRYERRLRGLFA